MLNIYHRMLVYCAFYITGSCGVLVHSISPCTDILKTTKHLFFQQLLIIIARNNICSMAAAFPLGHNFTLNARKVLELFLPYP